MRDKTVGTDVIVIGAGLSGLVATTLLLEQGRSVVLLEASDWPGGRILSLRDPDSGEVLGDLGPTWVWPPYQPVVAQWLKRLELGTFVQFEAGNAALDFGPKAPVQFQPLPGQHGIARIVGGPAAMIEKLVASLPDGVLLTGRTVKMVSTLGTGVTVETGQETYIADQAIVAVPVRVAEDRISWSPALSDTLVHAMQGVPTWMSVHAKALVVYTTAFWREAGLSGRIASRSGPLAEAHDISGEAGTPAAIFGFVGWPHDVRLKDKNQLKSEIVTQLVRCFGQQADQPIHVHVEDWADNPLICTLRDLAEPINHPDVAPGILRRPHADGRIVFGVSETADVSPGLIEGALAAGMRTAKQVLGSTV